MLVLVIPQTYILFFLFLICNFYFLKKWVSEGLKKLNIFWLASALVGSLFTSGLLHNFTQLGVKEVCLTELTLHFKKKISFSLKNAIVNLALL